MIDKIKEALNQFALDHDGVFVLRIEPFREDHSNHRLHAIPYFLLKKGTIVHVIDGRRPLKCNLPSDPPYIWKSFDLVDPECFEQIEAFIAECIGFSFS